MDHIAQIRLTKFVFLSFLDLQTILQKIVQRHRLQTVPVPSHCFPVLSRKVPPPPLFRCCSPVRPRMPPGSSEDTAPSTLFDRRYQENSSLQPSFCCCSPSFRSPARRISVACCAICIWLISSFGLSWITSFGYIRRISAIRYAGLCACPCAFD